MTRDVLTVTPETPLEEVADILERERFVRVPVAERGKLIGIVSAVGRLALPGRAKLHDIPS